MVEDKVRLLMVPHVSWRDVWNKSRYMGIRKRNPFLCIQANHAL